MKQYRSVTLTHVFLLVACIALTTSRTAAEPITGNESFSNPELSAPKDSSVDDALKLFKIRDYEGALKKWQELVKAHPDMPPAQLIMARMYLQAGMKQEALLAMEKAIADAPNDPEIYFVQAMVAMSERNLDKADSLLQKAASLMTTLDKTEGRKRVVQQEIDLGMAQIAEIRKDWAKASESLSKCLSQSPSDIGIRNRLAFSQFQQKDTSGALKTLREGYKSDAKATPPEIMMARFYQQTNDPTNAEHWLATALTAEPKNLQTLLAVGQHALDVGDLAKAQRFTIEATKIDPKSNEAKVLRGLTALYQHDFTTAESIFEGIFKTSPNVVATNNLALALIEQDDKDKKKHALEMAEANAKQFPKWPEILSTYAIVLYRVGRLDDAEKVAQDIESTAGKDGDTAYVCARIAVDRGNKDKAKQLLETALKHKKAFMYQSDAEELLSQLKQ